MREKCEKVYEYLDINSHLATEWHPVLRSLAPSLSPIFAHCLVLRNIRTHIYERFYILNGHRTNHLVVSPLFRMLEDFSSYTNYYFCFWYSLCYVLPFPFKSHIIHDAELEPTTYFQMKHLKRDIISKHLVWGVPFYERMIFGRNLCIRIDCACLYLSLSLSLSLCLSVCWL